MSAPWRGRQEQLPAGSRVARAGGKEGGEARRSAPGSSRGSGGRTGCGGRRRVPAHPAARAPPKAGTLRPLPQSWGRQKSPVNGGKGQEKGETRDRGPSQTWKLLEALKPLPPAHSRSAAAAHRPPPCLRGPQRARTSSSDPTPQAPVGSAEWGAPGCSFVSGAPRSPKTVGKGSGLLPRPVGRGQLVAECGFNLGSPELISGGRVGPSSSSPSENA